MQRDAASGRARALVLGSGGVTGVAWLAGALDVLGPGLLAADRVIGTSAGALVAARLLTGDSTRGVLAGAAGTEGLKLGTLAAARLLAAQFSLSRRHALLWLGRTAARTAQLDPADYLALIADGLIGRPWPPGLVVVAVDGSSGRPAYFTARSGIDLGTAIAASCAMPGVFPPVIIDGRPYLDGGLRSPANADLAQGCDRIVVLTPLSHAVRGYRRPAEQVARLGGRSVLLTPPGLAVDVFDPAAVPAAFERGRKQAMAAKAAVDRVWTAG